MTQVLAYEPLTRSSVARMLASGRLPAAIDRDDLLQAARLSILELERRHDPETAPLTAWLGASVPWALRRYVRGMSTDRRSRSVRVDMVAIDVLLNVAEAYDLQEESATRLDCRAILDQLSPDHRSVLWMRHAEGYSGRQIARALGITVDACESLVKRAMRAARAIVAGRVAADDEADTATLLDALREGAGLCGRLPGRHWLCRRTGLSERRVSRLMRVMVDRGLIVGRGPRCAGYLAERGGDEAA